MHLTDRSQPAARSRVRGLREALLVGCALSLIAVEFTLAVPPTWRVTTSSMVAQARPTQARPQAQPRQAQPRRTQPRQSQPRRTQPRQSQTRRTQPRQTQPRQTQPRRTQPRQTQPRQTQPRRTQPRQTQPRQTQPRRTQPRQTQPRQTQPRRTQPRQTQPRQTQPRRTQPRQTQPRQTQPRQTQPRQTQPRRFEPRATTPTRGRVEVAPRTGRTRADGTRDRQLIDVRRRNAERATPRGSTTRELRDRATVRAATTVRGTRNSEADGFRDGLKSRFGLERGQTIATETSNGRVEDLRRRYRLPRGDLSVVGPKRTGLRSDSRGRVVGIGDRGSDLLRTRADVVARRLGTLDRRKGDATTSRFGTSRRVPTTPRRALPPPPVRRVPGVPAGGAGTPTLLPPARHISFATPYPSSSFARPRLFFTIGAYNPAWWWGCSSFGLGYGYSSYGGIYGDCVPYGYSVSALYGYGYTNSWCSSYYVSPFRTICYSSPYHYRYRPFSSRFRYGNCYYTFSPRIGFYPSYLSSYTTYTNYRSSAKLVLPETQVVERELSLGELRFCEGWTLLRSGNAESAGQVLYTASLELEESALVHWFLALALAGTGELELASHALGEALFLDPTWFSHRWNSEAHLGANGAAELLAACRSSRDESPLDPAALALEASLALLDGDETSVASLRGEIAESLLLSPEAPALAEILAEIRRRAESKTNLHPSTAEEAWLAFPSCEGIPSLDLQKRD